MWSSVQKDTQLPPILQAAAFWHDDEEDLNTIPADNSGNVNYIKSKVAYRMGDGSVETASVSTHPDKCVDKLLSLARETETTQAIDRLRSVRSSLDDNKIVWILCNIPVDIRVENLMSWDDYQTLIEIVNTEDCFVVHKEFPYFKNMKKATKSKNLQKWRKFTQTNSSSIRERNEHSFRLLPTRTVRLLLTLLLNTMALRRN